MKKLIRLVLVGLLIFTFNDCGKKTECLPIIYLQPCNSFTTKEAKNIAPILKKVIKENTGIELHINILDNIKLSKSLYNRENTRYRAIKILNYLLSTFNTSHNGVIALMHDDISDSKGSIKDYGIQGLAYTGKRVCVVSDYRIKNKTQFWKAIVHEFFHSFCELHHCADNNPSCLLREGPISNVQKKLCENCKNKITIR